VRGRTTDLISSGLEIRDRAIRRLFLARSASRWERAAADFLETYFRQHTCFFLFGPALSIRAYVPRLGPQKGAFREGLSTDLWHARHPPKPGAKLIHHSDHTGDRDLAGSQFLRDFLLPRDLRFGVSLLFWAASDFLGCLTLLRPKSAGDYGDIELAHLRQGHILIEAAARNLVDLFTMQADLLALSRAGYLIMDGHAVVRKSGKIVAAGKQAFAMIKSWSDNGVTQKLRSLPEELPSPLVRWCGAPDGIAAHPRWHVETYPFRAPLLTKHLLLRLTDGGRLRPGADWHKLTRAERDLVAGIVRGKSNGELAAARRTSPATVKNQLSRLFSKTGTSGRVELAVLFAGRVRHR